MKSHQKVCNAVIEVQKNPNVERVVWMAVAPEAFVVEVTFKERVITYDQLSSTLKTFRDILGQQSVSRFYDFSSGVLRVQVTIESPIDKIKAKQIGETKGSPIRTGKTGKKSCGLGVSASRVEHAARLLV